MKLYFIKKEEKLSRINLCQPTGALAPSGRPKIWAPGRPLADWEKLKDEKNK